MAASKGLIQSDANLLNGRSAGAPLVGEPLNSRIRLADRLPAVGTAVIASGDTTVVVTLENAGLYYGGAAFGHLNTPDGAKSVLSTAWTAVNQITITLSAAAGADDTVSWMVYPKVS